MPLQRRVPKRGFHNLNRIEYTIINLSRIEASGLSSVSAEELLEKGIIKNLRDGLKVLGSGELTRAVTVRANAFSESAKKKIEAAGGKAEVA